VHWRGLRWLHWRGRSGRHLLKAITKEMRNECRGIPTSKLCASMPRGRCAALSAASGLAGGSARHSRRARGSLRDRGHALRASLRAPRHGISEQERLCKGLSENSDAVGNGADEWRDSCPGARNHSETATEETHPSAASRAFGRPRNLFVGCDMGRWGRAPALVEPHHKFIERASDISRRAPSHVSPCDGDLGIPRSERSSDGRSPEPPSADTASLPNSRR
jgi:hypothetical protein